MTHTDAKQLKTELAEHGIKLVGVDNVPATTAIPTETVVKILNAAGTYTGRFWSLGDIIYCTPTDTESNTFVVQCLGDWLAECVADIHCNRQMAGTLETVNAFLTGAAWQRWR